MTQRIEGEARGIERMSPSPADPRTVLGFRVERFDESGDHELLAQIEMRGLVITGSVREGDRVRVLSGRDENGTFVASKVKNETTGAIVTARGLPPLTKWLVTIAVSIVVVLTIVVVYLIVVAVFQWGAVS